MAEYQKKPVVIEARQWDEKVLLKPLARWCGGFISADQAGPYISIPTLEGRIYAREGDWIIRGVKGEFYPCKPDIFNATYQKPASRKPWLEPEDVETLVLIAASLRTCHKAKECESCQDNADKLDELLDTITCGTEYLNAIRPEGTDVVPCTITYDDGTKPKRSGT